MPGALPLADRRSDVRVPGGLERQGVEPCLVCSKTEYHLKATPAAAAFCAASVNTEALTMTAIMSPIS